MKMRLEKFSDLKLYLFLSQVKAFLKPSNFIENEGKSWGKCEFFCKQNLRVDNSSPSCGILRTANFWNIVWWYLSYA